MLLQLLCAILIVSDIDRVLVAPRITHVCPDCGAANAGVVLRELRSQQKTRKIETLSHNLSADRIVSVGITFQYCGYILYKQIHNHQYYMVVMLSY